MKFHRTFLLSLFALASIALSSIASAQSTFNSGTITAQSASCSTGFVSSAACVMLQLTPSAYIGSITVNGSFTATLQFEISPDGGATWVSASATPSGGGSAVTSATAAGVWTLTVAPYTFLRVRASSYASGIATITLAYSTATGTGGSLPSGCSSSAGQITCAQFSTSGLNGGLIGTEGTCAATGFAPAVGLDLLCPSSTSGPLSSHGWLYSNNGGAWTQLVNLSDLTDVAGTSVTSGGQFFFPVGTQANPAISFTGHTNMGFWIPATNVVCLIAFSTDRCDYDFSGGNLAMEAGSVFAFSTSSTDATQAADVGISRLGPNIVGVGTGAASSEAGFLRDGNTCRITSDVSLTVNVANSFCSFSLPALSKSWAYRCDLIWAITAGTGTNTFSLGVNPSQTPNATTNVSANILTTQTGTSTQGVAALSASGALNVLTSPTYTPAATLEQASAFGTLSASGTAGTFAITATAAGTTVTAAVKAGSYCELY